MKMTRRILGFALTAILVTAVLIPSQAFAATKQVNCPDCEGTGHVDCHTCYNQLYVDCPDCDWGKVDCQICGGNIMYACGNCGGSGSISIKCQHCGGQGDCTHCGGSGIGVAAGPCQECGETGIVKCYSCDGTRNCYECGGKDPDCEVCWGEGCLDCDENGDTECSSCYGSGYCDDEPCWLCGGEGNCSECGGEGSYDSDCKVCDGEGWLECECGGEQVDCETCHGEGDIRCTDCTDGTEECTRCSGTGKITVTAYCVSYDLGEGSSETAIEDTGLYAKNEKATVSTVVPTLHGHNFLNWNDGDADYASGAEYEIGEADVTLTAVYAPKSFTVSFFTDMEEITFDPITVTFGSAYGDLPEPEAEGFEFLGWYLGTDKIENTTTVDLEGNATLSAEWLIISEEEEEESEENENESENESESENENENVNETENENVNENESESENENVNENESENETGRRIVSGNESETVPLSRQGYSKGTWVEKDGTWQYQDTGNSYISCGWSYLDNPYSRDADHTADWFYFNNDGNMVTGFVAIDGNIYYFNESKDGRFGAMLTGWQKIGDDWYYFSEKDGEELGKMLKNTITPDGFKVDENGKYSP